MRGYHYVREGVESNQCILVWIPTENQLAAIGILVRQIFKL